MSDRTAARRSIESVRKEAKGWLRALRGTSNEPGTRAAHERFARALGAEATTPVIDLTLRDVQHALARELGYAGWSALKLALVSARVPNHPALQQFELKAHALFDAYRLGTPDALERHYALTWHRRSWETMRSYIQLDLGKRPAYDGDDVAITLDDARYLVAIEHDFVSWDDLEQFVDNVPSDAAVTARPVHVHASDADDAPLLIATREWGKVLELLTEYSDVALDANGQMTDEMLAQATRIPQLTVLRLGNSRTLSDDGIKHLVRLPGLRELDLSHTRVTDEGLNVLSELPALESLNLVMTSVTDAGVAHVAHCSALQRLHLMWTRTGDGAIRALAGKEHFTHLWSGNEVTDDGLALLHDIPAFKSWRGGKVQMGILEPDISPNQLSLRGAITHRGVAQLRGLNGLCVLHLDDVRLPDTGNALEPLLGLPNLAKLGVDPSDSWMPVIARMQALRFLGMQDATVTDDGFAALGASQSIEYIWGRRSYGLQARGFHALSRMPKLRGLSTSLLNVSDSALAGLAEFPALRELMPMDVPDSGYRHIGRCHDLEALLLMYCRDTTDAATEQITGLSKLQRYFNSYTTITDRTPELLSDMYSLQRITFDACNDLTDAGIAALARLPRLQELRVSGNGLTPGVTKAFPARVTVHYAP